MNKHLLLGAGLVLTITFAASPVFAQFTGTQLQGGLMPCASLEGKVVTGAECDAADAASGFKHGMMAPTCVPGQSSTPQTPCTPQSGQQNFQQPEQQSQFVIDDSTKGTATFDRDRIKAELASGKLQAGQGMQACMLLGNGYQMSVRDCLQSLDEIIAGKIPAMLQNNPQLNSQVPAPQPNFQNQQFSQQQIGLPQQQNQQSLFGQQQFNQQQTQPKIISPTIKNSGTTLASKGLQLSLKMQLSLNSKYKKAKGKTQKLAAVRSIAKKLLTLCRYISSGDDEADLDENAFDCDAFVAGVSEPIGEALQAKDHEVAYESTVAALESFGEVFDSLK